MKNTEQKPDWENVKIYSQHVISVTRAEDTGGFDVVVDIAGIIENLEEQHKADLAKQEAEYKKENWIDSKERQAYIHGYEEGKRELKQQHRAELEGLKMERQTASDMKLISSEPTDALTEKIMLKEGFNQAVDEINKAITNLLDKGEGK